jgi:hypothetical protein
MSTQQEEQKERERLGRIVRQVVDRKEPKSSGDLARGERFAIEAAQRAVKEAYGVRHKAATAGPARRRSESR